jgi:putative hemolysin
VLELAIALGLIVLNGLFALAELAIVSARKSRLRTMAEQGRRGARAALSLAEDSGRFLSTVQIGITLVGILAGAFSGAALGGRMTEFLRGWGVPGAVADPLGYGLVIAAITYLSLIIGELVPKQLALRNPEGFACTLAPMMKGVSRVAAPAVWLLEASTDLVLRLVGRAGTDQGGVTEDEIKSLIGEAESAGVIEQEERQMITGVLRLGDRHVRSLMTPRTEVDWLDVEDDQETIRAAVMGTNHSRLPVGEGSSDNMLGVVQARDVLAQFAAGEALDIRRIIRPAPIFPDTLDALEALARLRAANVPMALVHDEYGHFEGLVTPADTLEAIVGAFRGDEEGAEPGATRRADGSWLLAGWMAADEMADTIGIVLPENRDYHTVAGFLLGEFKHLPQTGEHVDALGWRFEVVDLDGRRIDKVLASPLTRRSLVGEALAQRTL